MSELISIIVPVYNVENYLDECINSLIMQTYSNIEIILVDDGSTDSCPQKCDVWSHKDNRIKVIHKPNGGLSDARNTGIDIARGEYLMFVDSDDFVEPTIVSVLYDCINRTNSEVACGGVYSYSNGTKKDIFNRRLKTETAVFTGMNRLKALLNTAKDCAVWGKLYRKAVIGKHRFIKGRYNEDVIFLFGLYPNCKSIVYTSQSLYNYRVTYGSITNTVGNRTMDCLKNALEMEMMAKESNLPVKREIEEYKLRISLELGYIIQRSNQMNQFPNETKFVKDYLKANWQRMLFNPDYNWRDYIHAIINLVRL